MRCPFCGFEDTQVKDSRPSEDGLSIRRRRFCNNCNSRFTTFERVQIRELIVVKKGGEKKPFDRDKLAKSVYIALRKRPFTEEQVEMLINKIVYNLESIGDIEIATSAIGEKIMEALADFDQVAYVRFASVYKDFREPQDFNDFIKTLGSKLVK